jgi:hypothetical protein
VIFLKNSLYNIVYKCIEDTKLIWFQYEIDHRFLASKYLLRKMDIIYEDNCSFCHNQKETSVHLFCDCDVTQHFLEHCLKADINDRFNFNIQIRNRLDILSAEHILMKL